MAKVFYTDGRIETVEPKSKKDGFRLQELYDMLGCELVEVVDLSRFQKDKIMIVDEEGALKNDACLNPNASVIANTYIFGNALVCNSDEFK